MDDGALPNYEKDFDAVNRLCIWIALRICLNTNVDQMGEFSGFLACWSENRSSSLWVTQYPKTTERRIILCNGTYYPRVDNLVYWQGSRKIMETAEAYCPTINGDEYI